MRKQPSPITLPLFAGALIALAAPSASASVIDGSVNALTAFSVSNLEVTSGAASDNWVIYGPMVTPDGNGSQFTSKTSTSPFSTLTRVGGEWRGGLGGRIKFSHDGGFGDFPDATASADAYGATAESATFASINFSYTMQGTDENFSIYYFTKDTATIPVDLSAVLGTSGGAYTATDVVAPVASAAYGLGRIDLTITGATIGETLDFTLSTDYSSYSGTPVSSSAVGLAGVSSTIVAVPEPSTYALLAGLGVGMLAIRRRQQKRREQ